MKKYPYNFFVNTYMQNENVTVYDLCNGYTAINQGGEDVLVNGVLLKKATTTTSGESISFGGNLGEIFNGRIDISFPNGTLNNAKLVLIQKVYLNF